MKRSKLRPSTLKRPSHARQWLSSSVSVKQKSRWWHCCQIFCRAIVKVARRSRMNWSRAFRTCDSLRQSIRTRLCYCGTVSAKLWRCICAFRGGWKVIWPVIFVLYTMCQSDAAVWSSSQPVCKDLQECFLCLECSLLCCANNRAQWHFAVALAALRLDFQTHELSLKQA